MNSSRGGQQESRPRSATAPAPANSKPPLATWETCKQQGNQCFSQGQFTEAITHYTRAIQHNARESKLFSNRALCNLKLLKMEECKSDAERAAELDRNNSKAYYLQGRVAFAQLRFSRAVTLFKRGMELCCLVGDASLSTALYGDLFNAYFVARRELYTATRQEKVAMVRQNVDQVKNLLERRSNNLAAVAGGGGNASSSAGQDPQRDAALSTLEQLYVVVAEDGSARCAGGGAPTESGSSPFASSSVAGSESPNGGGAGDSLVSFQRPMEIPDCFLCPITLDIMRDPVILNNPKSGLVCYDRNALQSHFDMCPRGEKKDPISHDHIPTPEKWMISNVSLRNAIHQYLEAHPWLYTGEIGS